MVTTSVGVNDKYLTLVSFFLPTIFQNTVLIMSLCSINISVVDMFIILSRVRATAQGARLAAGQC